MRNLRKRLGFFGTGVINPFTQLRPYSVILLHMELYRPFALRSQRNDTLRGRRRNKGADVDVNRSFVRWLFRSAKCITLRERGDTPIGNNIVALLMVDFTGYLFMPRACTSSNDGRIARFATCNFLQIENAREFVKKYVAHRNDISYTISAKSWL